MEESYLDAHYLTEKKGTQEIGVYSFQYNKTTKVHLIDTPGFDDTNRTDFRVLEEIASFLSSSYKEEMEINGIIYLHRISDIRMQGSSMTSIRMFRKLVGTDFYPHVVLATTMWELVDHDAGVKRETELISDSRFWGYMKERGCKFRRLMNTKTSAMDIIGIIVGQQSGDSLSQDNKVLAVQSELVDQRKDLIDTNVGREVQSQFSETIKRQEGELATVKEELRLVQQTQGIKIQRLMIEQRETVSQELKRMAYIQQNMRQEMQRELERREKDHQVEIQRLMQTNEKIRAAIAIAEKSEMRGNTTPMAPTSSMPSTACENDLDSIIDRLLEVRNSRPGKQVQLLHAEIEYLAVKARELFLSQPSLLELKAPMKIVGDIRGQYYDLLKIFQDAGFPPEENFLFLGNYVDHGKQSLETISLCLAWKIKYPEKFFMLRGSHECAWMNRAYGFYDECKRRYNSKIWKELVATFDTLPLAAIIDEKIMCMSGGLSFQFHSMDQIRNIRRPTSVPDVGLITDLLWSKPCSSIVGWDPNEQGVSWTFGADVVEKFCRRYEIDLIVRGNQWVEDGFGMFAKRKLVSLWSARDYQGCWANAGAIMTVEESLKVSIQILKGTYPVKGQRETPEDDEYPTRS